VNEESGPGISRIEPSWGEDMVWFFSSNIWGDTLCIYIYTHRERERKMGVSENGLDPKGHILLGKTMVV
jgi:hypothetical protein